MAETLNLRHLRMVQTIGRVGGVSGASRELCASQPAVTHAVAKLEAEIGVAIFERCATGSYPTTAGRQFLLRVNRFFEILDGAVSHVLGRYPDSPDRVAPRSDRLMSGSQLRSFLVAAEQGKVNEIARSLALSPTSLLRSARTLERALARPLFDRTARGLVPNKTGEFLARESRRALREIELARGEIMLPAGAARLEIVVGALPMAGSHEMAAATRRFMAAHPSVGMRIVIGEYDKLLADLIDSRIDLIFGLLRRPEHAGGVREELLFHDRYCVVARPGHPLDGRADVTAADLAHYPWVVPSICTPRRRRIEALFDGIDPPPRFHLETSSLTMSRALLLASDTVTLMTRSEVQHEIDDGLLAALRCPVFGDRLAKGVTSRCDWLPTRAHEAFLDCLRHVTTQLRTDRIERRALVRRLSAVEPVRRT